MNEVTYSLKLGQPNSENYYNEIRAFTDEVLAKSSESLASIANEYVEFLHTFSLEEVRETEEYIFELISFGVLWNSYCETALAVKRAPFLLLARMSEWRKRHQRIKPIIDFLRGIGLTIFLLPKIKPMKERQLPTLDQIDHVCRWFEATGEFREEALRFVRWRAFWQLKSGEELKKTFSEIANFRRWFVERSEEILGKYTSGVEAFLVDAQKHYRWREDRVSCSRSRDEYHLNMVGAEIMNRAFKKEFLLTKMRSVLVPGCMRGRPADECKAVKVKEGLICEECLPECRVNQLRKMGKRNGFDVYVIPHASDLSLWSPKPNSPSRGVIASACVTTLVEGGWELKRYNVPAQCVLLDYSGCKKHWRADAISTELNIRELKRIFN